MCFSLLVLFVPSFLLHSLEPVLQFQMTPLHITVSERDVAAVRELLQLNCDVSLRDEVGGVAAHYVVVVVAVVDTYYTCIAHNDMIEAPVRYVYFVWK